jgi:hypothetical protein
VNHQEKVKSGRDKGKNPCSMCISGGSVTRVPVAGSV